MLKERIREILKADKISLYELALDIGISNSSLYSILYDKHKTTPEVMNKVTGYIATYLTKDEKLEGYRLDNEEIREVNKTLEYKIGQLQKENERLKEENFNFEEIVKLCRCEQYQQTLQEIKEIAEKRNYLDYNEALDDILNLITKAEEE